MPPPDEERQKSYRASILDRLIDDDPGDKPERPPFRVQSKPQYARSVVRDLQHLFNTRCNHRFDVGPIAGPRNVLDYGVDDFTHLSPQNFEDRDRVARTFRDAIVAFEPRLRINKVIVEEIPEQKRVLLIKFDALLIGGGTSEPVSFGLMVNQSEGTVQLSGR